MRGGHWTGVPNLCLHSPAVESNINVRKCVGCGGAGRASATCERTSTFGASRSTLGHCEDGMVILRESFA